MGHSSPIFLLGAQRPLTDPAPVWYVEVNPATHQFGVTGSARFATRFASRPQAEAVRVRAAEMLACDYLRVVERL